ncbi:hypothetical protein M2267_001445 [Ensifer sp. KUDG1]
MIEQPKSMEAVAINATFGQRDQVAFWAPVVDTSEGDRIRRKFLKEASS